MRLVDPMARVLARLLLLELKKASIQKIQNLTLKATQALEMCLLHNVPIDEKMAVIFYICPLSLTSYSHIPSLRSL